MRRLYLWFVIASFTTDSILESSNGGSYGRMEGMTTWDQVYQLFQPSRAIKFLLQDTEAWRLKDFIERLTKTSKIVSVNFMRCAIS